VAARDNGWELRTVLKSGCPATDIYFIHPQLGRAFANACQEWRRAAQARIREFKPALVITGNSTSYVRARGEEADESSVPLPEWKEATRRTLLALTAGGTRVLQVRDTPAGPFDVPTCLARAARLSWYPVGKCALEEESALRPEVYASERAASAGMAGLRFADFSRSFCGGGWCEAVRGDVIVFQDSNHMTARFARTLAPALAREVRAALAASAL
jgi:hypothetical protein